MEWVTNTTVLRASLSNRSRSSWKARRICSSTDANGSSISRMSASTARALAVDADILLMDEPFASVDEQIRRAFQEDLLRLLSEARKTVVFVTHSIEEAVYVSDQIVILTRGPGRVSSSVRPEIARNGASDEIRRSQPYLDAVEEIWGELRTYAEEDIRAPDGRAPQEA